MEGEPVLLVILVRKSVDQRVGKYPYRLSGLQRLVGANYPDSGPFSVGMDSQLQSQLNC